MKNKNLKKLVLVGVASASFMASQQGLSAADQAATNSTLMDNGNMDQHACKGQNSCKGKGNCKTESHACKGQNTCKGQGGCKTVASAQMNATKIADNMANKRANLL